MLNIMVEQERCTALANMLRLAPQRHNQQIYLDEKPKNECGTTGCVAGWSWLWKNEIVSIALDGTMTWPENAMAARTVCRHGRQITLRSLTANVPFGARYVNDGAEWLGLDDDAASALFIRTARWYRAEELAIEVLMRLGDGRLDNDTLTERSVDRLARELGHYPRPNINSYLT